jgi:DNA-binding XRE family transcriptional regulator
MNEILLNEARTLVAGFIKNRRQELGLSHQKLADMCGCSEMTIIRMEQAKFWPNMKQFITVCHALNLYFFVEEKEGNGNYAKTMRTRWTRKSDAN